MTWDYLQIVQVVQSVLQHYELSLREDQAVYGIDSLDEIALQERIAVGLNTQYDIAREVHYPSTLGNKLSHRQRCDLILSHKGFPLKRDDTLPGLFDPIDQTEPSDALWLEIKTAQQFKEAGVRHAGYSQQWSKAVVDDLKKMEADPLIHHAGLLLIVFTETQEIAQKDIQLLEDTMVRKEVLAGFRQESHLCILDRMGHTNCTIVLWPTIQREC